MKRHKRRVVQQTAEVSRSFQVFVKRVVAPLVKRATLLDHLSASERPRQEGRNDLDASTIDLLGLADLGLEETPKLVMRWPRPDIVHSELEAYQTYDCTANGIAEVSSAVRMPLCHIKDASLNTQCRQVMPGSATTI